MAKVVKLGGKNTKSSGYETCRICKGTGKQKTPKKGK